MALRRNAQALAAVAVLALVFGSSAVGAGAQQPPAVSDQGLDSQIQILSVEQADDQITLDVAVPSALGRLAPVDSNFAVTDGDQLVAVTVTALGAPGDTMLVLDTSGSMTGAALDAAKAAARSFIQTVPADTRVGLESFGERVVIHHEPTLDRASLLTALDAITRADGQTSLWDALVAAGDLVGSDGGPSSVVVLSDGEDTTSAATPAEAIEHLSARSTILYAVAVESPEADFAALQEAVDQVGGQFLPTTEIGEFESVYTEIAGRLANRYQLTFAPSQQGTRTVVVSVAAGGAVATARTTLHGTTVAGGPAAGDPVPDPDGPVASPALSPVTIPAGGPLSGPLLFWIGTGSIFGSLALVGLLAARTAPQVQLATVTSADRVAGLNAHLSHAVDRLVSRHDRQRRLDALLDAADIALRPGEFVLIWLIVTALTGLLAAALVGLTLVALVVPLAALGAVAVLKYRAGRRRSRFADQLTSTLGIMANSLRAGQSLRQAIELVAAEAPSPTAEQFHRIHFEIRVGRDLTESMRETARRMDNADMEWLAQAVDIHRELGGDLTEILQNLGATLRERRSVARQVDALSAEGRATGWVLLGMPIVLFLFSWWRTPDSIGRMMSDALGRLLLAIAVGGMTIGHLWIRRLVKVKY